MAPIDDVAFRSRTSVPTVSAVGHATAYVRRLEPRIEAAVDLPTHIGGLRGAEALIDTPDAPTGTYRRRTRATSITLRTSLRRRESRGSLLWTWRLVRRPPAAIEEVFA
jgi:hypothetical protein